MTSSTIALRPASLEELKKVNPKDEATGRRKHKHFRWLTNNIGYPKLREHLGAVVATMKLSSDWHDFKAKLDKNYPRQGRPTQLSMEFSENEPDTGKACKRATSRPQSQTRHDLARVAATDALRSLRATYNPKGFRSGQLAFINFDHRRGHGRSNCWEP
jgi:hypothetical protein